MAFIHEDFLLHSESAHRLYHDYAAAESILDFHSHLSPKDIAENRQFADLYEIWLEGDHYKWRAMRANGVPERLITGDASPYEKFMAWAKTVPATLRNPLYHWTHLELKRYFGIDELLDEKTAPAVWEKTNSLLAKGQLRTLEILKSFKVRTVCTTDDPTDDLCWHKKHASSGSEIKMFPTFRPDKALNVDQPEQFNGWVARLSESSEKEIRTLTDFLGAIKHRHDTFHEVGCRLSDHGLPHCYSLECSQSTAAAIFTNARSGHAASGQEHAQFASFMMLFFGRLDAEKGWTKQLHLGTRRNANTRALQRLGPDTGFDSIGDWPQAESLGCYLDVLDRENALPKTIVYNLNPADNYIFATMIGNFQDGQTPGKVQLGSGWWFLDQKEGMEWQLNALSNAGLLSRFVGMVTDSRSFMSFPRHEYFRRVLCNLLGNDMERSELPNDFALVGSVVRNICLNNARQYLGFAMD